jgi:integrase
MWTNAMLKDVQIPEGKSKLTLTDPEIRGLTFEVRPQRRSFFLRYTHEGRQRTYPIGPFPTLSIADARKKAEEIKRRVLMGSDPLGEKRQKTRCPTFREFFHDVYLPYSRGHHRDQHGTSSLFKHHIGPRFGSRRMNEITKLMVRNWTRDLMDAGYAPSMINRILVLLGHFYTLANELDIEGVPLRSELRIKLLRVVQKHTTHLSQDEVRRLSLSLDQNANPNLKYIISFLLMTGARKSEAIYARWEHIRFDNRIWFVPLAKSGQPRNIFLSDAAMKVLYRLRQEPFFNPDSPYVFPNPKTRKPYGCIFASWKIARAAAGLPDLRIHDLRHSYASTLVNNGVSLYDVQKLLGHSSIKTTQRYAHLSAEHLFQSAAVADRTYGNALGVIHQEERPSLSPLPQLSSSPHVI